MKNETQLTETAGRILFISHSSITDMVENSTLGEIPWGNEIKKKKKEVEEKTERKKITKFKNHEKTVGRGR